MNRIAKLSIFAFAAALLASAVSIAQDRGNGRARPSPNATVSQNIGTTVVSITYGRPGLKGRDIQGLVPQNKVWRTGANESTAITFSGDVKIAGKAISAGTYSLYSMPVGQSMTLIFNSKLSWGTQYDESQDIARVSVSIAEDNFTEWFTIDFDSLTGDSANLNLRWGDYVVIAPITTG